VRSKRSLAQSTTSASVDPSEHVVSCLESDSEDDQEVEVPAEVPVPIVAEAVEVQVEVEQESEPQAVIAPAVDVSMFGLVDLPTTTLEDKQLFHRNLKVLFYEKKAEFLEGKISQEGWDAIEEAYVESDRILCQTLYKGY
jgi:hypothetical protein